MNGRNDVMILTLNQRAVGSTPTRPTQKFSTTSESILTDVFNGMISECVIS